MTRNALVAGSSRGIGRDIARALLADGYRTCITGRQAAGLAKALSELQAAFGSETVTLFQGDLGQADTVKAALEMLCRRWGALHCLVANIGSGRGTAGWAPGEAEWQRMFDVNLWTSIRLVEAAIPLMAQSGGGAIVLVASIVGLEATSAPLPYSAAKAALINYGKNLSRLVADQGIRVNIVAPGNVLFPGGSWEEHLATRGDEVVRYVESEVPMKRFGNPEEIGSLVAFLCSERASFITGSCFVADGGQTRRI